jgi:hypothetical protein
MSCCVQCPRPQHHSTALLFIDQSTHHHHKETAKSNLQDKEERKKRRMKRVNIEQKHIPYSLIQQAESSSLCIWRIIV